MNDNSTRPLFYIDEPGRLQSMVDKLQSAPSLSIDTESNSLYVYREQLCLIQISLKEIDYLVDPLALPDLSALVPIFANPRQEKIFHAAEYDLICLKRDYGFEFANIFDTMIAARILGEKAFGLAALLESRLGITLNKKYQRANWGIRPLPTEMREYAREDSQYLFELRSLLAHDLKEKSLWNLALEDFRLGCEDGDQQQVPQPPNCWKVAGSTEINSAEAAILQSLCDYREELAQKKNVPPFKIFTNEVLVHLTKEPPATLSELAGIRGLTPLLVQRYGNGLLQAVKKGQESAPLSKPHRTRPDEKYLHRIEALKDWRKAKAKEILVESDVILPRDFVEIIAAENPTTMQSLHEIMAKIPWRYQHFSKEIFSVLRKQEVA